MKTISKPQLPLPELSLFRGIEAQDVTKMLHCLRGYVLNCENGDVLLREGEPLRGLGIVLSGRIHLEQTDFWGNRSIISDLFPGDTMGAAFGSPEERISNLCARAAENSSLLFLDLSSITTPCNNLCPCHTRMIRNLVSILTDQSSALTEKMEHLSKRTTRRKVISYLSQCAKQANSVEFDIPFDRQELADYLFVERSALSWELAKMKQEGLIDFRKNHFRLKQQGEQ